MNTIRIRARCSVPGCPSRRGEVAFVGNVCMLCLMFLRSLTDQPLSQAAKNAERRRKMRDLVTKAQELDRQLKGEEPS
jgi:transcriptional regulator of met regulon